LLSSQVLQVVAQLYKPCLGHE